VHVSEDNFNSFNKDVLTFVAKTLGEKREKKMDFVLTLRTIIEKGESS
jgi:hypothetical protein